MVERVERLLGAPPRGGFVGTFHRFALQLLRTHPREVGLPQRFAIADEDDQRRIVEGALKKLSIATSQLTPRGRALAHLGGEERAAVAASSSRRPRGPTPTACSPRCTPPTRRSSPPPAPSTSTTCCCLAVRLLEREEAIRKGLVERFRWMLVDEYQDTNAAQARLLELLERQAAEPHRGRRRGPVDLPLARRRGREHPALRRGVPGRGDRHPRAQLPVGRADPEAPPPG